jgi:hypothetical protein
MIELELELIKNQLKLISMNHLLKLRNAIYKFIILFLVKKKVYYFVPIGLNK